MPEQRDDIGEIDVGRGPRCPSHPKAFFNAFAAVMGTQAGIAVEMVGADRQSAMKPRVRYASETVATLGWHQLCTSVWLRPMWARAHPLHHVWVVQFEGRVLGADAGQFGEVAPPRAGSWWPTPASCRNPRDSSTVTGSP